MTKKKKRKKLTKKEQLQRKQIQNSIFFCFVMAIIICILSYFIFFTEALSPKVNQLTASYISFNNQNTTDMLKVSDLKIMSDKRGMSIANESTLTFNVTGNKNTDYDIVLYPINNKINLKEIKFVLTNNKEQLSQNDLGFLSNGSDEGIIIYQGKISDDNNLKLQMWLSKEYKGNTNNIAFEVKVKPR